MAEPDRRFDGAKQMRVLLHSLPVLVTTRTRQGEYTGVFTDHQVLDYPTPRDLIGERTRDVLNPPAAEAIMDGVRATLDTGEHQRIEYPLTIGGERFWRIGLLAPYDLEGDGDPDEAILVSFDASEGKAREQALSDALEVLGSNTSRSELEAGFCDRLVAKDRYVMAWIGEGHRSNDTTIRATAGADGYLDDLRESADTLDAAADPGIRSLRTHETETEYRIEPSGDGGWQDVAAAHGAHAAVAVPLAHNGVSHGVLTVYVSDSEYMVPWREDVLELYGDAVGYGLSAAMRQWILGSEATATLDLEITDGMVLLDLCQQAGIDTPLRVESVVPQSEGTRYYITSPAGASGALTATATAVDGLAVIEDETVGDGVAVIVDARTPESQLASLGVNFERFRVTASEAAITAAIPRAEGIRPVVDLLREAYAGTTVSVAWGEAAAEREPNLGTNVAALLTDRQYEALEIAYRRGYFEKDRRNNLSEIADSLPVSRWTFTEHLRVAQRKLLAHLLD